MKQKHILEHRALNKITLEATRREAAFLSRAIEYAPVNSTSL